MKYKSIKTVGFIFLIVVTFYLHLCTLGFYDFESGKEFAPYMIMMTLFLVIGLIVGWKLKSELNKNKK